MSFLVRDYLFWRRLLPALIPLLLLTTVVAWVVHASDQQERLSEARLHAQHAVGLASDTIREELTRVATDLAYLAHADSLHRYVEHQGSGAELAEDWRRFMVLHRVYSQIRFLDTAGMEKVRVNFNNGSPVAIPPEALQDKSQRYYFRDAMALQPGEIYVSPLDLNVENHRIAEPHAPTMRFAMQVTNGHGQVRGLLIINYSAYALLNELRRIAASFQEQVFLANSEGYWLLGPPGSQEWGFMFPHPQPGSRVADLYPGIWQRILKDPAGSVTDGNLMVAFRNMTSVSSVLNADQSPIRPFSGRDFPWIIMATQDMRQMPGLAGAVGGSRSWVATVLVLAAGLTLAGLITVWRLTTSLRDRETEGAATAARELRLRSVLNNLSDGILLVDRRREILCNNPAAECLLGMRPGDLERRRIDRFLPTLPANTEDTDTCPLRPGFYRTDATLTATDARLPVDVTVHDIVDQGERMSLVMVHDASDRIAAESRQHFMTTHDLLTGLANRLLIEEEARELVRTALAESTGLALLYIDLDDFKQVNDTKGHHTGDEVIKGVAARLEALAPPGSFLGRVGGDEFAILVPEVADQSDTADLANRIIGEVSIPVVTHGSTFHLGASIGISFVPNDSDNTETLLKHASVALYNAKRQGGNSFMFFDQIMNQEAKRHVAIDHDLRVAVREHQFVLHYQPKRSIARDMVTGFEALLRWQHPDQGLLPPGTFIAELERSKLIVDVGYWTLENACRTVVGWNRARKESEQVQVAVNFSGAQFRDPELLDHVRRILRETGCRSEWLEIEITESILMENLETAERRLWALHEAGVSIAIDDFGTGYSSLAYLKRLPVKVLKVDRSFIQGLPGDANDRAIVDATVTMAKRMNLQVVAEGVETDAQYALLRDLGVDYVQGFLFGRPVRVEQATALLGSGGGKIINLPTTGS